MKVFFHGDHTTEEAAESLLGILRLFQERYGINDFRELNLDLTLVNVDGEDVELIDSNTSNVLDTFEVYQDDEDIKQEVEKPMLELVVDNTKDLKSK